MKRLLPALAIATMAAFLIGCADGCTWTNDVSIEAQERTRSAVSARLDEFADRHPEARADVEQIIADWPAAPTLAQERELFDRAKIYLVMLADELAVGGPADALDAQNVRDLIASTEARLIEFETPLAAP